MKLASHEVTKLLRDWGIGDESAPEKLMPLVYDELRRLAHQYMRRERHGHTLQTSALVNEAYVRLVDQSKIQWESRAHFFGIAAHLMRQILVDQARRRNFAKRGGGAVRVSLNETTAIAQEQSASVVALEDALKNFGANRSTQEPNCRAAFLWRNEHRGNSGGAQGVAGHGDARMDFCQGLAAQPDECALSFSARSRERFPTKLTH